MNRRIHRFFTEDHRRVDKLLEQSTRDPNCIDEALYRQFRIGLLTHIKMEENILFPAAKKANAGKPLPNFQRFRNEHGALTTLMAVYPNPEMLKVLRHVLEQHDAAEEVPGGMYDVCEKLTEDQTDKILEELKRVAEVPVHEPKKQPAVLQAAKRILKRSGYDYDKLAQS